MTYQLRRATPGDLPEVSGLLGDGAAWMRERGYDAWPEGGFPDHRLTPGLAEGTIWLLHHDHRPVGTMAVDDHPDPEFTERPGGYDPTFALIVHRMAVHRDHRHRGLGPVLLDWARDHAHRAGRRELWLNCNRKGEPLQRFYLRCGFVHMGTVDAGRKSGWLARTIARPMPGLDRHVQTVDPTRALYAPYVSH